jgi:hypothetical protein
VAGWAGHRGGLGVDGEVVAGEAARHGRCQGDRLDELGMPGRP